MHYVGQEHGWVLLEREYPYSYRLGRVRRDRLRISGNTERTISVIENLGAVYVVPVTEEGDIVLIQQYRYAVDEWVWEIPAGGLFDHEGDPADLAVQELREEIGGEADRIDSVGWFYDSVPVSTSKCHVFLARGVRLLHEPNRGATELIEMRTFSPAEAMDMALSGAMTDGRSALALLRCASLL
ncbi:NUDIX hydrolase [Streptomyces sp. NPDC050619]|uniref:NUDIX hydrolase n=1 Tax=Streptomyces sp. NPDC050619 TaxID=3157214 RepID=UPI00341FEB57